jgi:alpha-amylase
MIKSINEIYLSPESGKEYWINCHREWREEFMYFLLVDRFHDSVERKPLDFKTRQSGYGNKEQLQRNFGGTIKGII